MTRLNYNHSPGPWPGRLVPSSHQRSKLSNSILGAFSTGDKRIWKCFPIPNGLCVWGGGEQWVCVLYLEDYLIYGWYTWEIGSVCHRDWPYEIHIGQWPKFQGPVILFNIFNIMNIILEITDQCDTRIGLIKYLKVSDLYFMVKWCCLISWRLLYLMK